MDPKFPALVEKLAPSLGRLLATPPMRYGELPREMPASGVYLFTERGRHLYVGRSNTLRKRYGRHCRLGATHRQASFAFQLARETTGRTGTAASYRADESSRAGLILDPVFAAAFAKAKERIRAMEYRYVKEADQNRQALLEIYCAVVLATPYNDLGTH
jgi:hypothetical protein